VTDLRACPTGVHPEHDGLTCRDAEAIRRAEPHTLTAAVDRAIHALTQGQP